ncbi:ketosamine-3-kinase-like [Oscarella lobularis]|uniref:ketosamine-3-kinase-like n=1 Tax=Oscarella lobularis TaxID=121494 RepID=UPI0033141926
MERLLRSELRTQKLKHISNASGGCINDAASYDTDFGKVFIKFNAKSEAKRMFEGEFESLLAIESTNTVRVPSPKKVIVQSDGSAAIVMEHFNLRPCRRHQAEFGAKIADLHLHNSLLLKRKRLNDVRVGSSVDTENGVRQFGFDCATCCGFLPQKNEWADDWEKFFLRNRLSYQVDLIEQEYGDWEVRELWPLVQQKIPKLFVGLDIQPALLHGDLWRGNIGETDKEPVTFDPASFYGHSEFELAIGKIFHGFDDAFYDAYHAKIPKAKGYEERLLAYELFHYLNHWNHFGIGYRQSCVSIMQKLIQ